MTNITAATNTTSLTGTQSTGTQTNPTDSLFQETLSGLQQTLQNLAAAHGDTAISVKDATVGTTSPISGSQSSGSSLTVSGDIAETKIVNGKNVTQMDSFNYTQLQNSSGFWIDFNIPVPQSDNPTINEQASTTSNEIGEVSALVSKYVSAIEGTISDNGKNFSVLLAEINSHEDIKSG